MKFKLPIMTVLLITTAHINAAHHEEGEEKVPGQGLISSEIFDLAGEMDLYVEKYASCGASKGDKHMHMERLYICLMANLILMSQVNFNL
jgi:hypothetical protein